jgi:hypothetical protein
MPADRFTKIILNLEKEGGKKGCAMGWGWPGSVKFEKRPSVAPGLAGSGGAMEGLWRVASNQPLATRNGFGLPQSLLR